MYNKLVDNWDQLLEDLKYEYDITEISFKTWIKPLKVLSVSDDTVTLVFDNEIKNNAGINSDNSMAISYVNKKYYTFIKTFIDEFLNKELDLKIVSKNNIDSDPFSDTNTVLPDGKDMELKSRIEKSNLSDKFTFESFVVGANNNIAQSASLAVAESLGTYNPLFIYGGVGLGKTHLLQSIGIFVLENNPDAKVLYTSSEPFTNEVIDIIRRNKQEDFISFRKKYRTVDLLLIDDIQFLAGKDRTQEEIFNIINELYMNQKQIVITSDKKPKDIDGIMERLINRFEQGLTVDIQNPDYETRMAILQEKVKNEKKINPKLQIDKEVLDYIANNFSSNVRELDGAFTRVTSYSKITRSPITLDFTIDTLSELVSPGYKKKITPNDIIDIVADHFQIKKTDICSERKNKAYSFPRQICMYLCREYTDENLITIAKALNKANHATVSYGYEVIAKKIKEDPEVKNVIDILNKKIDPN